MDLHNTFKCMVAGCDYRSRADVRFHAFPKDPALCRLWTDFCKIPPLDSSHPPHLAICNRHFKDEDYLTYFRVDNRRRKNLNLNRKAKPSLFPPTKGHSQKDQGVQPNKPKAMREPDSRAEDNHPEEQSNEAVDPITIDTVMEQLVDPDVEVDMEYVEIIQLEDSEVEEVEVEAVERTQESSVSRKCRLCFKVPADEDESGVDLFDENGSLLKDLVIFFQLQFQDSPEWPSNVCGTCVEFIKQMKAFRSLVMTSHSQFYKEFARRSKKIASNRFVIRMSNQEQASPRILQQRPSNQKQDSPRILQQKPSWDMIKCEYCEEQFCAEAKYAYHRHVNTVHKDIPFECETCGKKFANHSLLRAHRVIHLPPSEWPFKCPQCEVRFTRKEKVQTHIEKTHDAMKQRFICEECGKRFSTYISLVHHRRRSLNHIGGGRKTHTGHEKRGRPCEICGLKFLNLSVHKKLVHGRGRLGLSSQFDPNEEVTCPAETCGKVMQRFEMRQHSTEHFEGKGSYCEFCMIRIRRTRATKHKDKHLGTKYPCEHCDRVFNRHNALYMHLKKEHEDVYLQTIKKMW